MTTYADIATGRLVYTCNCGWVDTGHANPTSSGRQGVGAQSLWQQLSAERGPRTSFHVKPLLLFFQSPPTDDAFMVRYTQDMGKLVLGQMVRLGTTLDFAVRRGLSLAQREQVALSIFHQVTHAFETFQNSWWLPASSNDSSYSQEDLVSNLIGFYRVVRGFNFDSCQPVSIAASQAVWKATGAVGATKNRRFEPIFHPCEECSDTPKFPAELQSIVPAMYGLHHRPWTDLDYSPYLLLGVPSMMR